MAWKLGEFYIEFATRGISAVSSGIDAIAKSTLAWSAAGLIGTTAGTQLTFGLGELAREITAIALPAIQALTMGIMKTVDWLRSLSGNQQDLLFQMGTFTVGLMAVGKALAFIGIAGGGWLGILLKIVGAMFGMGVATGESGGALARLGTAFGRIMTALEPLIGFFEKLIDVIGSAVAWLVDKLAAGLELVAGWLESLGITGPKSSKPAREHRSMERTAGGTEGVMDTYKRVQQAALNSEVNWPRRGVEIAQQQLQEQQTTNQLLQRQPGTVGR